MQLSQYLLIATAYGGLASATALQPRPAEVARDISPRQTSGNILTDIMDLANTLGLSACVPYALPLVTALPSIPRGLIGQDLISQALSQTTLKLDEVCKFSITGSVGTIFSDFIPTAASFFEAKSAEIASIIAKCPSASVLSQTVAAYTKCPQWSGKLTVTGGSGGSTSRGTSTAGRTTTAGVNAVSTSTSKGVAPRETGYLVSGAALAGVMAIVAAL
jgi:hypothetical protein